MKFICSQESLMHGIQIVQKGISNKIGLPIYSGILFDVSKDNKVHLFATDLEIGIDCYVPAQVIENGAVVLPNRIVSELIRKFPEGNIEIESKSNNITTIKENNSIYKILGFSADEFSNFPEIEIKSKLQLSQNSLKESIQKTLFSASRDENRSFLNGALFKISDNKVEMVTTDSHRLSLNNILFLKDKENLTSESEVIIPYRTLAELYKLLNDEKEVFVDIHFGEKQIIFILFPNGEKNSIRIYSRLIEGQFPNYHQIIPKSFKTEIKINTEEFLEKMERISLFVREEMNVIKLEIKNNENFSEGQSEILLKAASQNIGEAYESILCFKKGEDITITFNSKYLLDVLKVIKTKNTEIKFNDPLNPVIIYPDNNQNYLYVLMPVRTD